MSGKPETAPDGTEVPDDATGPAGPSTYEEAMRWAAALAEEVVELRRQLAAARGRDDAEGLARELRDRPPTPSESREMTRQIVERGGASGRRAFVPRRKPGR